jgi:hypothetical protein
MSRDSTEHLDERTLRAMKRLPLDPGPFQDEWFTAEPTCVVPVLPGPRLLPALSLSAFSKKSLSVSFLSTAALLLVALSAFFLIHREDPAGPDSPAIVLFKKGDVALNRKDQALPLTPGFQLQRDDRITVAAQSRLDLRMPDGSLMQIQGEAEIRLLSLNRKIALEQKKGSTYHSVVPSTNRQEYSIQTPTAIASVRGTRFAVENGETGTVIRVAEGSVETSDVRTDEQRSVILNAGEEAEIVPDIKDIEKKRANTTVDLVIYSDLDRQRDLWNPEVMKQVEGMHATADEGQIEKIYSRPLEILYMTDGRILKGVVAAQVDRTLILHTTDGVIAVPIEELQEVRFQRE